MLLNTNVISGSAGRGNGTAVLVPTALGDGGAAASAPLAPPSALDGLKHERAQLCSRLERMRAARDELEAPANELQRIDDERHALELANAGAVSDWVSRGCEGSRPALDPGRLSSVDRRREIALAASNANAAPLAELAKQADTIRARLGAIEGEITAEAAAILGSELEGELTAVRVAADELNAALGRVMGLRVFALSHRGNRAFMPLVERLLGLSTPEIGSTKIQIEHAAQAWRSKFAELVG
jgi:hypothetical protein